ncbi:Asp-tRNA(Asn)/Glu-tRNA(Gln) amidotransferase subunit GatC [Candidatus Bathyarchaeota archaeon]|nr:MAG: Asp-tRNA(Asn)/Glu-tRNA(Gln) amidotransferase subunit GatC [Candidatus Bathyarchaeota archaeon]
MNRNNRVPIEEVKHIAELAHIELSSEEERVFTQQFNKILDYFSKIDEVNTDDVPPTYHVIDLVNVYREDNIQRFIMEDPLKNAPKKEDRYFKSPRIV